MSMFRYDYIFPILKEIGENYNVKSVETEMLSNEPCIVMRHDIDISLRKALDFATLEQKYITNATYYIMVSSPMYNINTKYSRSLLRAIKFLGFDIGLHFDPKTYNDKEDYHVEMRNEIIQLSNAIDKLVVSVSIHNPSVLGKQVIDNKLINAWTEEKYGLDGYKSDSRMNPLSSWVDFVNKSKTRTIQLNLHSDQYSHTGWDYGHIFAKDMLEYISEIDHTFDVNSMYKETAYGKILYRMNDIY